LPQAIRCFRSQTYPSKELLIISEAGAGAESARVAAAAAGPDIRLIEIEAGRKIGEKRNFGCSRAAGEIIAHWDDDDFSAPERLADQIERLMESGKAVTGYSSIHFGNAQGEWWLYTGSRGTVVGTSLCYRRDWAMSHPFPAKQIGEDSDFMHIALRFQQLATAEAGMLMGASIHKGNTSPRKLNKEYHREPDFAGIPGMEFPCD
jgi:glycosyltransferase involved in cell wall biosynthesis